MPVAEPSAGLFTQLYGDARHHALLRRSCCNYMAAFPERFAQFVAGDFARYLGAMRQSGTWGDQVRRCGQISFIVAQRMPRMILIIM
jgi:hypothetical protein